MTDEESRLLGMTGTSAILEKTMKDCPFCNIDKKRIIAENALCYAIFDIAPVTDGHALVISKAHYEHWLVAPLDVQEQTMDLVRTLARKHASDFSVSDFNIGMNCGSHAGQTVMHMHTHLIPRRIGDTPWPRGGVRGVIPLRQAPVLDKFR